MTAVRPIPSSGIVRLEFSADELLNPSVPAPVLPAPPLSDEQQHLLDVVDAGRDAVVEATVGAGKTSAIQALCTAQAARGRRILYLTYSRLLKHDAQARVRGAYVQNCHGFVYPFLLRAGVECGIGASIREFNRIFVDLDDVPSYDLLVVDEYQDLNEETARLLRNVKSVNPSMQVVLVGDMEQRVRTDTRLDAHAFATEICRDPALLSFTGSFRVGPSLGRRLSAAWNKPVRGLNTDQRVRCLSFRRARDLILAHEPGEIMCLGQRGSGGRSSMMSRMLNQVEKMDPERFNKRTVYASIRDADAGIDHGGAAIFTTFDAAKGLERPLVVVLDFDEAYWRARMEFPDTDPEVLRNIFLVAASRGKSEIVFVNGLSGPDAIGSIPISTFTDPGERDRPEYPHPFLAADCFDFTYGEDVVDCLDLLERMRLDDGDADVIGVERSDALIDLSPVVGHWQESLYFDDHDARAVMDGFIRTALIADDDVLADHLQRLAQRLSGDAWTDSLLLAAAESGQMRYADQVDAAPGPAARRALVGRLATGLPPDADVQREFRLSGDAVYGDGSGDTTRMSFAGITDAIHDGRVVELKFTAELSDVMFLQVGLYLVLTGLEDGLLWNTRTDERWSVRVPDRHRFMDAVTTCVTKHACTVFQGALSLVSQEDRRVV